MSDAVAIMINGVGVKKAIHLTSFRYVQRSSALNDHHD